MLRPYKKGAAIPRVFAQGREYHRRRESPILGSREGLSDG
jgi:hypothetical protein